MRFKGAQVGGILTFGDKEIYRVVGTFTAGGSAAESEVWADLKDVEKNTGRDGSVSCVQLRAASAALGRRWTGQIAAKTCPLSEQNRNVTRRPMQKPPDFQIRRCPKMSAFGRYLEKKPHPPEKIVRPPSTGRQTPVTKSLSTKLRTALATFSGRPSRLTSVA